MFLVRHPVHVSLECTLVKSFLRILANEQYSETILSMMHLYPKELSSIILIGKILSIRFRRNVRKTGSFERTIFYFVLALCIPLNVGNIY